MDFVKLLKEKISPIKGEQDDAFKGKEMVSLSEDDPFLDPRGRQINESNDLKDNKGNNEISFLKNSNMTKSLRRSRSGSVTSSSLDDRKKTKVQSLKQENVSKNDIKKEDNFGEDDEVTLEVLEEMSKLVEYFPILSANYRLIDKIGEGTFSTVYKAEALNGVIKLGCSVWRSPPLKKRKGSPKRKNPIVALKQIYVTSSPNRIYNELNLLYMLTGNSHVAPLLDVLRYQDQVVAILPYYHHCDFRDFYRDLPMCGIKKYLWELFQGLDFIHEKGVIHRDLKPTNFLYDPFKGRGVLVDFGLAEKVQTVTKYSNSCPCQSTDKLTKPKRLGIKGGYPKQDSRPPRRANRAGTRGFRAPEVLFKCTNQSTKLDIWSAGIIGLSIIARKFPLLNSPDDTDALLELSCIFGVEKLQKCADIHGCCLEISVDNLNTQHKSLTHLLSKFLRFEWENESFPSNTVVLDTLKLFNKEGDKFVKPQIHPNEPNDELLNYEDHVHLMELLNHCFHMNPKNRSTANDILKLPFFNEFASHEDDEVLF